MASRAGPVRAFPMQLPLPQQTGQQHSMPNQPLSLSRNVNGGSSARSRSSEPRSARPQSAQPQAQSIRTATAVGPTLSPDLSYRAPGGTVLNRVPHAERHAQQLELNRRETVERLREKAMDKRIAQAVALAQKQQQRPHSAAPRRSASAKKSGKMSTAQRQAQQQFRAENAFVSQDELQQISQPLQLPSSRPQSAAQQRPGSAAPRLAPNGMPIAQLGIKAAKDRDPLLSQSAQSRLTAAELAEQPVAGMPSNGGAGNDLAAILGGGHEYIRFGNKNAPSAQTRQQLSERPPSAAPAFSPEIAAAYAPYATHDVRAEVANAPLRYNDPQSGAVVVRDELTLEGRHAPAAIGFGKRHAGYREYVAKPAAASAQAREQARGQEAMILDPFGVSKGNSILSWQSAEGRSRKDELRAQQEAVWSRTSADYGAAKDDPNLNRPVAGLVLRNQEPLALAHGEFAAKAAPVDGSSSARPASASPSSAKSSHTHGPSCGPACRNRRSTGGSTALTSNNPFASSVNNPLNPYTNAELAQLTKRPSNLAASSLGFGKAHPAYKTHVLSKMAPSTVQQQP